MRNAKVARENRLNLASREADTFLARCWEMRKKGVSREARFIKQTYLAVFGKRVPYGCPYWLLRSHIYYTLLMRGRKQYGIPWRLAPKDLRRRAKAAAELPKISELWTREELELAKLVEQPFEELKPKKKRMAKKRKKRRKRGVLLYGYELSEVVMALRAAGYMPKEIHEKIGQFGISLSAVQRHAAKVGGGKMAKRYTGGIPPIPKKILERIMK